jgi:chorismate dehydratase
VTTSNSSEISPLTIAASTYLNSAPLIWSFLQGSKRTRVKLVDAVPGRCAELLRDSAVEVALIPIIEYQRIPGISLICDVCVGSKTEVRSVVLVSKQSTLSNVRSVALDESSRTSATLVKIIFREFLKSEPVWINAVPDLDQMLADNDAALIIGDPAMTFSRNGLHIWDMAALWRGYTDFGFVFAMWAVRDTATEKARGIGFPEARDEGTSKIDEIVDDYLRRIPLGREELTKYLTENIVFNVDTTMRRGMDFYFELAAKHRLIENIRPLVFV